MRKKLSVSSLSDIGLVRNHNEDACKLLEQEHFFVLADGMGGHQAGEVASREAVEQLCRLFQQQTHSYPKNKEEAKQLISRLIQEVNQRIYRMGRQISELRGMGTTLCCTLFHPEGLIYGYVGDSRIYLFRQRQLHQLTQDHSLLQELIDLGQLSEEQAGGFLYKNIITKAIGTEPTVEPTVRDISLEPGDQILMCSDGLTDMISPEEIRAILNQFDPEESAKKLVYRAKQKGGYDNITVILVKVGKEEKNGLSHLSRL